MSAKTKNKKKQPETTMLVEHLPLELKANFKAACAKQKTTIREAVKKLMTDFIASTAKSVR